MAIFIFCNGFIGGGAAFGFLPEVMRKAGHTVVFANTTVCFNLSDRERAIKDAYVRAARSGKDIFLVGHDVGALAALLVTEEIEETRPVEDRHLQGLTILSPMMPGGITRILPHLAVTPWALWKVVLSKYPVDRLEFFFTKEDLEVLNAGVIARDQGDSRGDGVSSNELREVLFSPPHLWGIHTPVLHLFPARGKWATQAAQYRLGRVLAKTAFAGTHPMETTEQFLLLSEQQGEVLEIIVRWYEARIWEASRQGHNQFA